MSNESIVFHHMNMPYPHNMVHMHISNPYGCPFTDIFIDRDNIVKSFLNIPCYEASWIFPYKWKGCIKDYEYFKTLTKSFQIHHHPMTNRQSSLQCPFSIH